MTIYDFGWNQQITNQPIDSEHIARLTLINRSFCKAITQSGEVNIYLPGRFHTDSQLNLATGDFVRISPRFIDEQNKSAALLEEQYPRFSKLSRIAAGSNSKEQILAANLNFAFIVTSSNDDFNLNRIQRFILLAQSGGVTPVIVLSKIDLIQDPQVFINKIKSRFENIDIVPVSAPNNIGTQEVQNKIHAGETAVFVGSSGVGKSTLVNQLIGEEVQHTLEIRDDDSKGRHTTTSRELFFLKNGGMVIDTAGLREVHVFADTKNIENTFSGIAELAKNCKFTNCKHATEPGCAIQEALKKEEVDPDEYKNYLKLQKEAQYAQRKLDKTTSSNDKRRWKKINQDMRSRQKLKNKN